MTCRTCEARAAYGQFYCRGCLRYECRDCGAVVRGRDMGSHPCEPVRLECWACGEREHVARQFDRMMREHAQCSACGGMIFVGAAS